MNESKMRKILSYYRDGTYDYEQTLEALMEDFKQQAVVNRFEVIDWVGNGGRVLSLWRDYNFTVEASLQDDSRTIKIFLRGVEDE